MKTLITGGSGFIGSRLAFYLPDADILDVRPCQVRNRWQWHQDIRGDIAEILPDYDRIYHLAALTSVQDSIHDPDSYWSVNVDGTQNLLAHLKPHQDFLLVSTAAAIDPVSPYGRSKRRAEKITLSHGRHVMRLYNVFGPGSAGVITHFIHCALRGAPLHINGDGLQLRTFTHVDDICNHLANMQDHPAKIAQNFQVCN